MARFQICPSDSIDYLSNALALYPRLGVKELYIDFGPNSARAVYPIHTMYQSQGAQRAAAMTFFHPFTGGDRSSSFNSVGKVKAYSTWSDMEDEITPVFCRMLSPTVFDYDDFQDLFKVIQKFVVVCYSRVCPFEDLTKARYFLFTEKRKIGNIPPAKASLLQHIRRCVLDADSTLKSLQCRPSSWDPLDFGWILIKGIMSIFWSPQPEESKALEQLKRCGCKGRCSGNCGCLRAGKRCGKLCACNMHGTCSRDG